MTTLLIDIGNTRTHAALAEGATLASRVSWPTTDLALLRERLAPLWGPRIPDRVRIASVRPSAREAILAALLAPGRPAPRFFGADLPVPIPIRTREPESVGVDRLLIALAAGARARGAAIAVGLGSAVTLNIVSAAGEFLGGAIAPGLPVAARALHLLCEQLPEVSPAPPASVLGRTTLEAMQAGLVAGTAGLVEGLVRRTREELGFPCRVYATGGDALLLAPLLSGIDEICPDLVFEGMLLADPPPGI